MGASASKHQCKHGGATDSSARSKLSNMGAIFSETIELISTNSQVVLGQIPHSHLRYSLYIRLSVKRTHPVLLRIDNGAG